MAKEYKDLVVGLDIGAAKVMAVVAEVMPGGELKLAGFSASEPICRQDKIQVLHAKFRWEGIVGIKNS